MIKQIKVGPMDNFSYIIWDKKSSEGAVVDVGWENEKITKLIKKYSIKLKYILLTHTHFDHSQEAERLKEKTNAKIVVGNNQEIKPDILAEENTKLKIGDNEIKTIKTPGHSKEGVCYLYKKFLFTGDTIFQGGSYGRTDLEGGNFEELKKSIKKILALNEETIILPGHDYGDKKYSSIKEERGNFKELL